MQAPRLLPLFFAVAIFSTSCSTLTTSTAPDGPVPPVDTTINTEAAFPNDGLTRLIVTPIAGAPALAVLPEEATTAGIEGPDGTDGGAASAEEDLSRMLTPDMLVAVPPGAALAAQDGVVGYTDADGEFVPLVDAVPQAEPDVEEPAPEVEVDIPALYGNPYIDALAVDDAIEKVTVIGDGTFGIETTDPSVIDSTIFAVVPDVALGITVDQYESYQWHLENDGTNLDRLGDVAQTEDADLDIEPTLGRGDGNGVVVAVIDSGVDFSHADLENSAWSNLGEVCDNGLDDDRNGFVDDCHGWDFAYNDAQPFNAGANSHGTHVAGIITANRNSQGVVGVAPGARIMDLNVAYPNGSMTGAAITAAIRYAVDNGADIINMSLGTNPGASPAGLGGMLDAIDYAGAKGVLVVVAAGNSNVDLDSLAVYPASFDRSNMLVVGASGPDDAKASFSNHSANVVDLYAPGEYILSTTPGQGFYFMSGTSQASPAVAGIGALIMESNPDASMEDVLGQILATVDEVDTLSSSTTSGRANAAGAMGLGEVPALPTELEVQVAGLVGTNNEVNAEVAIRTPPEVFDEPYHWELSLIQSSDVGAYAIIEHPFEVAGTVTATGLTGALILGSSEIESIAVSTRLPDGEYSFVIESIPSADGTQRLGDAFVTTFVVTGGSVVADETTATTITDGSTTTAVASTDADGTTASTTTGVTRGDEPGSDSTAGSAPAESTPGAATDAASPGSDGTVTTTTSAVSEPGTPASTAPQTVPTTSGSSDGADGDSGSGAVSDGPATTTGGSAGGGVATETPDAGSGGGSTAAPTTTQPPATVPVGPAPVPPDVGDDAAVSGNWEISSINPRAGYTNSANSVTIRGSFPRSAYVWFDEQPGEVVYQSDDVITVRTPRRPTEGVADLTLRVSGAGFVLEVPDAYAFVDPASGPPAAVDTGDDETNSGDDASNPGAGGDPGTDEPAADDGSGDAPAGSDENDTGGTESDADDGGSSDSDEVEAGARRSRMVVGSGVALANGLTGAAITPNVAANTPVCTADPCSAVRR